MLRKKPETSDSIIACFSSHLKTVLLSADGYILYEKTSIYLIDSFLQIG
ncbi:hypothetical protein J4G02_09905 [Candidatus Poribacteria bacterium]|nr:hypothetical protein [Candidatus Poribacteria bacterium]